MDDSVDPLEVDCAPDVDSWARADSPVDDDSFVDDDSPADDDDGVSVGEVSVGDVACVVVVEVADSPVDVDSRVACGASLGGCTESDEPDEEAPDDELPVDELPEACWERP